MLCYKEKLKNQLLNGLKKGEVAVRKYIERPIYLNKLIRLKDKQLIKVITGIRRCGNNVKLNIM